MRPISARLFQVQLYHRSEAYNGLREPNDGEKGGKEGRRTTNPDTEGPENYPEDGEKVNRLAKKGRKLLWCDKTDK
jgi:hypothetical protein